MQDVSLMSRAELVCALITSTTMTAKAAVTYAKTRDPAVTGNRDALVSYKTEAAREQILHFPVESSVIPALGGEKIPAKLR
jgi:hypothetical protein